MCHAPNKPKRQLPHFTYRFDNRPAAEQMLREAAFVLQMTQRVKTAMLDEKRPVAKVNKY